MFKSIVTVALLSLSSQVFAFDNFQNKPNLVVFEDSHIALGIEMAAREFARLNECSVTVKHINADEQVQTVIDAITIQHNIPDVFIVSSDEIKSCVDDDLIEPLSFMKQDRLLYTDSAVSAVKINNSYYGAPRSIEAPILFYNKKISPVAPVSLTDFRHIKEKHEDIYPLLAKFNRFYYAYGFLKTYGAYLIDENNTKAPVGLNQNNADDGLRNLILFCNQFMPKDLLQNNEIQALEKEFKLQKAYAIINDSFAYSDYAKSGIDVGFTTLPRLDNGFFNVSFL